MLYFLKCTQSGCWATNSPWEKLKYYKRLLHTQPDHVIWVRCFVVVFSEQSGHVTITLCSPWQGLSGAVYYSIIEPFKVEL